MLAAEASELAPPVGDLRVEVLEPVLDPAGERLLPLVDRVTVGDGALEDLLALGGALGGAARTRLRPGRRWPGWRRRAPPVSPAPATPPC
jgi:hypothetical protein